MIIKDTVYTKWLFDHKTEESESEELFSADFYEYKFDAYPDDEPLCWFVQVNENPDTEGIYNASDLFDTKEECVSVNQVRGNAYIIHCGINIEKEKARLEYLNSLIESGD